MSRICVKNLPKYVKEDRLRDLFSQKGEITDVQLMRNKDGKSRQFAFIGYRSEQEAQEAIKYFNKSFIDTSRISLEMAHKVGDEKGVTSSSRISKNGNAKGEKKIMKEPEVDDPAEFQAFLDVTLRGKSKVWSNDISIPLTAEVTNKETKVLVQPNTAKQRSSDTEKTRKRKVVALSSDVSDVEYFKSRVKKNLSDTDSDSDEHNDADVPGNEYCTITQEVKADSDHVLDNGRLIVRNLPSIATEEEIMEHFSKFGEISEVHLVLDKETKRSKGFAYIHYLIPESAARAIQELHNSAFQGRCLRIEPAEQRSETSNKQVDFLNLPKTFKTKKEEQRKASEASGCTKAWNSLFIQPDTVLENMVRMYGVSKSKLLDRESEDPAVRLALGEAKVIAETKKTLAKAGVNVTSLEEFATEEGKEKIRNKRILLVKNLPFATTEKELAQMFGKFGNLDKIIFPPTKAMALVVFLESADAGQAMKRLAYACNKGAPLYLEWAPEDILDPKTLSDNDEKKIDVEENDVRRASLEQQFEMDLDITESNSLHVNNLSIKTSDESLKKHLIELMNQGKILSVKIIKHLEDWENRSGRYGFVEFDSIETATSVYTDLQGTILDGHSLKLSFCKSKRSDAVSKGLDKNKACTKLHVKNVAFEATKKELRQLFSPFGQIKGLRLPKRNINQSSGYAFIEFMTMQEAKNAKEALSSTHFYGRHLVLEWANDDSSMKAIRARSGAKHMDQEENKNPKKRKSQSFVDKSRVKVKRIATPLHSLY